MQRYLAVDILKWWAIVAVVVIHLITSFSVAPATLSALVWVTVNQLARFCVPVFVALSGFALALKYSSSPLLLKEFYTRRVLKLLPMYIFWSIAIYTLSRFIPGWGGAVGSTQLIQALLFGKTDYQLYFVPMIFQLYALFPVLFSLWRRFPKATVFGAFALQLGLICTVTYAYAHHVDIPLLRGDQEQYILSVSWIFYFVLGIAFTGLSKSTGSYKKHLPAIAWTITIAGLIWSIYESNHLYAAGADLTSSTRFTRLSVFLYATGAVMLGFMSESFWQSLPKAVAKWQVFLGKKSYLIYLSHTVWLRIATALFLYHQSPQSLLPVTLAMLVFTVLSEMLDGFRLKPATSAQTK